LEEIEIMQNLLGSLGVAVVPPICGGRVKSKDIFMKRELGAKNTD
jgi:hypothetical protein